MIFDVSTYVTPQPTAVTTVATIITAILVTYIVLGDDLLRGKGRVFGLENSEQSGGPDRDG